MYIFAHLFAGVVIGLVLAWVSGRRILFWAAALGSLLPDLIDKPIGLIVLHSSVDNGRIYFHSLIAVAAVILIGLALIAIGRLRAGDRSGELQRDTAIAPPAGTDPSRPGTSGARRVSLPTGKAALQAGISSGRAARTSAIIRESGEDRAATSRNAPREFPYAGLRAPGTEPTGTIQETSTEGMDIIRGGIHSARPTETLQPNAKSSAPEKNGRTHTVPATGPRRGNAPAGTRTGLAGLVLVALALGMLSHQLLDAMWLERVNWFWPFLGRFTPKYYDNFWLLKFWEEVRNPSEWVFAVLVLVIVIVALLHWKSRGSSRR